MRSLWTDESGSIITSELVLVSTILVMGLVSSLTAMRDGLIAEMTDLTASMSALDQSYVIGGTKSLDGAAYTAGTIYIDGHAAASRPPAATCLVTVASAMER